ncbi:MAG TPA: hypothetical protein VD907_06660 [Verrucomicrobiae bacterium]|nr:hypothetical protein [Verrucomicrobiae bacterium]
MDGRIKLQLNGKEIGFTFGLRVIEDACLDNDIDFMSVAAGDAKEGKRFESVSNMITMAYYAAILDCKIEGIRPDFTEADFLLWTNTDMKFVAEFRKFAEECLMRNVPKADLSKKKPKKATGTKT